MQLLDGEEEAEDWIDATQCITSCHGNPWFDFVWHQWGERSLEVRAPCMGLRFLHADSVFSVWEGDGTIRAGKRSQDITGSGSSVPAPWQRLPAPSFCQRAHVFFFERPTLRVGHPAATTTRPMER